MDKQTLIDRLLALPEAIRQAELELLEAELDLQAAEDGLQLQRTQLTLNEHESLRLTRTGEEREAQIWQFTTLERQDVASAREDVAVKQIELNKLENEFMVLRAITRMGGYSLECSCAS